MIQSMKSLAAAGCGAFLASSASTAADGSGSVLLNAIRLGGLLRQRRRLVAVGVHRGDGLAGLHVGERLGVALRQPRVVVAELLDQARALSWPIAVIRPSYQLMAFGSMEKRPFQAGLVRSSIECGTARCSGLERLRVVGDGTRVDVDDVAVAVREVLQLLGQRRGLGHPVRREGAHLDQLVDGFAVGGDDVGVVLAAALLGDQAGRQLVRAQPQRVDLDPRVLPSGTRRSSSSTSSSAKVVYQSDRALLLRLRPGAARAAGRGPPRRWWW